MYGRQVEELWKDLGSRKGLLEFQLALNPALRGYVENDAFRGNMKYVLFVDNPPRQFVQFFAENFPCIGKENQPILERAFIAQ